MSVKKDLNLDKCTDSDIWKINILIAAINDNEPIKGLDEDLPIIVNLNICNLHLVMICHKNDDGSRNLCDYFTNVIPVAWKELVRRNALQIAEAHKIAPSEMQWYGAFHNTAHHPHIHLIVYSKDTKQGYLTNKAIEDMRSLFANDIFRNEMYLAFTLETQMRDEVRAEAKKQIDELLRGAETPTSASKEIQNLYVKLIGQLTNYKGKKVYGYLPKNIKQMVDDIVAEFAKDERIAELYAEWNKANREKLSVYYDKKKPDIPLEENKEFRDIKNSVIRSAVLMMKTEQQGQPISVNSSVGNLVHLLAKTIASSCNKRRAKLHSQIDSKLKYKIEQKKQAQGLKIDPSIRQDYNENEEQGFTMSM